LRENQVGQKHCTPIGAFYYRVTRSLRNKHPSEAPEPGSVEFKYYVRGVGLVKDADAELVARVGADEFAVLLEDDRADRRKAWAEEQEYRDFQRQIILAATADKIASTD
jgi:hypothetical protein